VAKSIIQLNKRIERLTRLYVGHTDNYTSLLIIVSRIRRHNDVTPELIESFETAEARFLELEEDDPRPNMKLLRGDDKTVSSAGSRVWRTRRPAIRARDRPRAIRSQIVHI
jgi:hypothetical protein